MKYLSPSEREELFGPDANSSNGSYLAQLEKQNEPILASVPVQQIKANEFAVVANSDAPACANCGTLMMKAGSCYSCSNCFTTTGVCN